MTSSISLTKVSFTKAEDYDQWNHDFVSKARALDLWEYIKPEGKTPWKVPPPKPLLSNFPKRNASESITSTADLTAEGKQAFVADWSMYTQEDKDYKEHRRNVKELTSWMQDTVAQHYRISLMKSEREIDEWYANIRKVGLVSQASVKQEVRNQYKAMVSRPLPKLPKDLGAWITKWETVVAKGIDKGMTELSSSDNLMSDLEITLQCIIPEWTTSFRMMNESAIDQGTLSYIEIAAGLRKYAITRAQASGGGKPIKGAFPTYGTNEQEESNEQYDRSRAGSLQGRERGRYRGRSRGDLTHLPKRPRSDTQVCKACQGFHKLEGCWYALPDKAPENWIPNPILQQIVLRTIKEDQELAKEVARISGKRQNTRSDIKSETPDQ
ncbi:hypothetical protein F5Y03DRAFT_124543 [Xylaria venustula]|nr:hypothetical protein F5Y03DRAFT_124543 [Xylaria venustula]